MTDKNKQNWIEARNKYHLSDTHIQMARELGMNPKKFGGLANHKQEKWKSPLPDFIEDLYYKRFKNAKPDIVKILQ
jgi:hypothetical protein